MFKYIACLVVLLVTWFLWPVYEFYAYRGKAEFLPFYQFIDIPTEGPKSQFIGDVYYQTTGETVLELASAHQQKINAPAISIAVTMHGEIVWAGASGWADIEAQIPVTPDTQFRIGSTSKALTSIGLARMVDLNHFDVDAPISRYFKELPNPEWANMSARDLASHTSGLPHYRENTDKLGMYQTLALSTRYDNVIDALTVFDDSELLFAPGSDYSYSSFGTVLLSAVMQEASKVPYLTWMKQQVFSPLGIKATTAEFDNTTPESLATFYWNDQGRSKQVRPWRDVDLSHRLAGGGFVSTSSDLVRLGSAFLDTQFISTETRELFWRAQALPNGKMPPHNYAVGWRTILLDLGEAIGEVRAVNHGGVSRGAQSWLMVLPEYDMAVAVNINANTDVFGDFSRISRDIAMVFIQAKQSKEHIVSVRTMFNE
ncbi:serine hydrolase domain-containing protein [Thalassotalea fusca]